jgi:Family of unknown function (DUF5947)
LSTGLSRFVRSTRQPRREPAPAEAPTQQCEMCAEVIGERHGHVVDVEGRGLMCTCRGCYLLFTPEGSGGGRFRAVPERYRYQPSFQLDEATWDTVGIPVRMAFFFTNSAEGRTVAFYPSPAGATESLLPLDSWREVTAANPEFADVLPDVEALLINRADGGRSGAGFECFAVPIDACYHLVGLVKLHWKGFDGGEEAWQAIDGFFDELRERSDRVGAGDG